MGLKACLAATYGQMYINNTPILLYMWIYLILKPGALIVSWSFWEDFPITQRFAPIWISVDENQFVMGSRQHRLLSICKYMNKYMVNWLIPLYKLIWNHHLIKYVYHEIGLGVVLNFHSDSSQMSSVEFGSELCSSTPDQPIFIWTSLKRPCETRLLKH